MNTVIVIVGCKALFGYWYSDLIGHSFEIIGEDTTDYRVICNDGFSRSIRKSDTVIIIENGILNITVTANIHIKIQQSQRWRAYVKKIATGIYPLPTNDAEFRKAYNFAIRSV
jgi:hypothetical protein